MKKLLNKPIIQNKEFEESDNTFKDFNKIQILFFLFVTNLKYLYNAYYYLNKHLN